MDEINKQELTIDLHESDIESSTSDWSIAGEQHCEMGTTLLVSARLLDQVTPGRLYHSSCRLALTYYI